MQGLLVSYTRGIVSYASWNDDVVTRKERPIRDAACCKPKNHKRSRHNDSNDRNRYNEPLLVTEGKTWCHNS